MEKVRVYLHIHLFLIFFFKKYQEEEDGLKEGREEREGMWI